MLREYARAREFHRHAAQLARSGWHPIAVKTSTAPFIFRVLNALSLGLFSLIAPVEPVLLVTYSTSALHAAGR
jgi:hypothetical protein